MQNFFFKICIFLGPVSLIVWSVNIHCASAQMEEKEFVRLVPTVSHTEPQEDKKRAESKADRSIRQGPTVHHQTTGAPKDESIIVTAVGMMDDIRKEPERKPAGPSWGDYFKGCCTGECGGDCCDDVGEDD